MGLKKQREPRAAESRGRRDWHKKLKERGGGEEHDHSKRD